MEAETLKFLKDNKNLIADNNFKEFYDILSSQAGIGPGAIISPNTHHLICQELSNLFINSGVDIFNSNLDYVPAGAFFNCQLIDKIILPPKIKGIGDFSFSGSSLREIVIPQGATYIDGNAFSGCKFLEKVTIPGSVKHIGPWVFDGYTSNSDQCVVYTPEDSYFDKLVKNNTLNSRSKFGYECLKRIQVKYTT